MMHILEVNSKRSKVYQNTMKQKLNALAARLKRYKTFELRKSHNSVFYASNKEKTFYI